MRDTVLTILLILAVLGLAVFLFVNALNGIRGELPVPAFINILPAEK